MKWVVLFYFFLGRCDGYPGNLRCSTCVASDSLLRPPFTKFNPLACGGAAEDEDASAGRSASWLLSSSVSSPKSSASSLLLESSKGAITLLLFSDSHPCWFPQFGWRLSPIRGLTGLRNRFPDISEEIPLDPTSPASQKTKPEPQPHSAGSSYSGPCPP